MLRIGLFNNTNKEEIMIFSVRYRELIDKGEFVEAIEIKPKKKIIEMMFSFNESGYCSPDRCNPGYTVLIRTEESVLDKYYEYKEIENVDSTCELEWYLKLPPEDLFDILELWYEDLSSSFKYEFQEELNKVFSKFQLQWRMADGKLLKIDKQQFDNDLVDIALHSIEQYQQIDGRFQSAYEEFVTSVMKLDTGELHAAITNAELSYESILKILTGDQKSPVKQQLKKLFALDKKPELPDGMSDQGFQDNVLSALPYIRNYSYSDHGAGVHSRAITKSLANLAVNIAAAFNIYLLDEYSEMLTRSELNDDEIPF